MKRYGGLWERLVCWENLVLAAQRAQRGKRSRQSVRAFNFDQERELLQLQHELDHGDYAPGDFRSHWIDQPKPRLISAAPYRDRVVHHALMNVLTPILERHFHPDSYACRQGKGTHAAASRLQRLMRRNRYALQCDVRKFFGSIDHEILKATFRRLIKDRRVLGLMDLIVDHSNEQPGDLNWFSGDDLFSPVERRHGLPIGNLTSQWFGNWMLSDLDHFVTSRLGIGGYVRYCDDFVLLHRDRDVLRKAVDGVRGRLADRRLSLHEEKTFVRPVRTGLTFVGYRILPTHRLLRRDNVRRFRRRVRWMRRAYADGRIGWPAIRPRLASWMAHARTADSERLIRALSREWVFRRDGADRVSGDSRRLLGQQLHELPDDEPQQQHARQSEHQLWIPSGPALSRRTMPQALNRGVYGCRERGLESPGPIPEPRGWIVRACGRMHEDGSDGSGRFQADGPVWPFVERDGMTE